MPKLLAVSLVVAVLACAPLLRSQSTPPLSPEELDQMLAPIALYPDPLLDQILPAAAFPGQIDEAAQFLRDGSAPEDIDAQSWDLSVKAVAHYPTVLDLMAGYPDWTIALGEAYANQPDEVRESIQRLRQQARDAANPVSTPQEEGVDEGGFIGISPSVAEYVYVPVYDPVVVYAGSGSVYSRPAAPLSVPVPTAAGGDRNIGGRHGRVDSHGGSTGEGSVARPRPLPGPAPPRETPPPRNSAIGGSRSGPSEHASTPRSSPAPAPAPRPSPPPPSHSTPRGGEKH